MIRETIKTRNGYSIVKETDDDGQVHYVVYGPNGKPIKACSALRGAEVEFARRTDPESELGGPSGP